MRGLPHYEQKSSCGKGTKNGKNYMMRYFILKLVQILNIGKYLSQNFILIVLLILSPSLVSAEKSIFERVWKFETDSVNVMNTVQAKPKEFDNLLLFIDHDGHFFALDKYTGSLVYKTKLGAIAGRRGFAIDRDLGHVAITGSAAFRVGLGEEATLFLLDAKSGKILKETPTSWSVAEPVLTADCIVTFGARKGVIQCHDRDLQRIVWRTELGSGARVWSNPLFSPKHNMIYLVTSDTGTIIDKNRSDDRYSSSLIGINAKTGSVMFSRQMIKTGVWDFDGVGKPILIENFVNDDGKIYDLIVGLNKTGTVFVLNAVDGTPIKNDQFKEVLFPNDHAPETNLSKTQTIPSWPRRVNDISLTPKDLRIEEARPHTLRHVKYGQFLAPSLNYDVVTRGLHGGPEWHGGEHFKHFEEDFLAIPYNNTSWILRLKYLEDAFWVNEALKNTYRIERVINFVKNLFLTENASKTNDATSAMDASRWVQTQWSDSNPYYQRYDNLYRLIKRKAYNEKYDKNCSSCHRNDRAGRYQSELEGDGYVPSLVGYTLTDKYRIGRDYSFLKSLHSQEFEIDEQDLREIFQHFDKYDKELLENKKLKVTGFWQALLGMDALPLNKGPFGAVAAINLNSGEKVKDIVVGEMKDSEGNVVESSIIFGGLGEINNRGESLLVGTVDPRAYYISLSEGKVLQTINLERPGSTKPHLTKINGCEAWVILETGGRFSFFDRSLNGFTIETFINKSNCS